MTGAGFRSGNIDGGPRYILDVSYNMDEVILPNPQYKFVRYQVNGNLMDTAEEDSILLSYADSGREGHLSLPEAEERALRAAEQKIPAAFENTLRNYLSGLASVK